MTSAQQWCLDVARMSSHQTIDRDGAPYLTRYFVAGWSPSRPDVRGPAVFLHHFVASDPSGQVHSHPWGWSLSLILVGAYREIRCDRAGQVSTRDYTAGQTNLLMPDDRHRIELLTDDVWTLFLAASFAQPWRFFPTCEPTDNDLLVF